MPETENRIGVVSHDGPLWSNEGGQVVARGKNGFEEDVGCTEVVEGQRKRVGEAKNVSTVEGMQKRRRGGKGRRR